VAPILLGPAPVDLHEAKARVAVAMVESIFRRARYEVWPYRGERPTPPGLREDLWPSFAVARLDEDGTEREALIRVEYRPFIAPFIALENQRRGASLFVLARHHFPDLYFVLVTDHPEPGHSCFQAVRLGSGATPRVWTEDLAAVEELGIFKHNAADHQELLLRIFRLLSLAGHGRERRAG